MSRKKYIMGVDEAGRGSWAGPVVAAAFCAREDFDYSLFAGLTDSKLLSPMLRSQIYSQIDKARIEENCFFSIGMIGSEDIDRLGIREANRRAMEAAILGVFSLCPLDEVIEIQIDGRDNYAFSGIEKGKVRYIIRGDLTEKVISAASVLAKATRDQIMCDFSVEYPQYGFHRNKGYGTKEHEESLLHYGITPIHRKSYAPIKRLISKDS